MNVFENIAFGLNIKKIDKNVIRQKVERMLKLVGLEGFGSRDVTLLLSLIHILSPLRLTGT